MIFTGEEFRNLKLHKCYTDMHTHAHTDTNTCAYTPSYLLPQSIFAAAFCFNFFSSSYSQTDQSTLLQFTISSTTYRSEYNLLPPWHRNLWLQLPMVVAKYNLEWNEMNCLPVAWCTLRFVHEFPWVPLAVSGALGTFHSAPPEQRRQININLPENVHFENQKLWPMPTGPRCD